MAYTPLIGKAVKRKEDPRFITGHGTYVANMSLPGMRYVAFVRSPYAHARIGGIDASMALRYPDVIVVTGKELAGLYEPMPVDGDHYEQGHTRYPLSIDRVRHVGEAVAAVIAPSPQIAEDVAAEVMVAWEPLAAAANPTTATQAGALRLFDDLADNIAHHSRHESGDVDGAFAGAHRIVRQTMTNQRVAGVPLECRAVVAAPDPTTAGVIVWSTTQVPHAVRDELARVLRLPQNAVRVIAPDVGGGFGVKGGIYPEDMVLAALARIHQVPLRWVETRMESMLATNHGRGQTADVEAAVEADGTVSALRLRVVQDIGAYPIAPWLAYLTRMMATGVYKIPAVDIECTCVLTNTTPIAAYRGAGRPEPAYYIERLMDLVANELDIDPAEVRRRNFVAPDRFPYTSPAGAVYDSGDYDRALSKAVEIANYSDLRAEQARRRDTPDGRLLGIGIACYVEICGAGPYESAVVRVDPGGSVTVLTGISPHGQGEDTTFAQIVADEIGASYDQILVRHGDTSMMPMGIGTFGSRGLAVGGGAVMRASAEVRDKARKIAAHLLEAADADIILSEGNYQVRGSPSRHVTLAEIAESAYSDGGLPDDMETGLESTNFFRPPMPVYPFGAHIAVVEIERETGIVHLRAYFSVDDCGPRISPTLVEGQVHGGLAQGIAQALLEEVVYDDQGQLLTGSLMDYAVPKADHFPLFVTDQTETPTPHNPLGAKGIGEAATIGSTPAIANAVMDALKPYGIRHLDMPFRAEKVWRAISDAGADNQR